MLEFGDFLWGFSHILIQMLHKHRVEQKIPQQQKKGVFSILFAYIVIYVCINFNKNLLKRTWHTADFFPADFVNILLLVLLLAPL